MRSSDTGRSADIEVIYSASKANGFSVLMFLLAIVVFGVPYAAIWDAASLLKGIHAFMFPLYRLAITLLIGMLLHEALHGITWALFSTRGFRSIRYGMKWKHMAPYTHCTEPLRLMHYAAGVLMPGVVLGVCPALAALVLANEWLLWFGIFFTAGAAGDLMGLWHLRSFPATVLVQDHPIRLGFIVRRAPLNTGH